MRKNKTFIIFYKIHDVKLNCFLDRNLDLSSFIVNKGFCSLDFKDNVTKSVRSKNDVSCAERSD